MAPLLGNIPLAVLGQSVNFLYCRHNCGTVLLFCSSAFYQMWLFCIWLNRLRLYEHCFISSNLSNGYSFILLMELELHWDLFSTLFLYGVFFLQPSVLFQQFHMIVSIYFCLVFFLFCLVWDSVLLHIWALRFGFNVMCFHLSPLNSR